MKGLLLKDFYEIKSYLFSFILLDAVFIVVSCLEKGNIFIILYPCIFSGMTAMSLIAYEEKEKWNVYADTLPYKRSQIVSAKYLISIIYSAVVIILMISAQTAAMLFRNDFDISLLLGVMTLMIVLSILPISLLLPFIFKFGVEKTRIYMVAVNIISFTGLFGISALSRESSQQIHSGNILNIGVVALLATVVITAVSWMLSIRAYKKRQL